jgi:hypothetical protein
MSITISTNRELGVLEVTYLPGTVTPQELAEQRSRVADAVSQSNIRKVLIDATALVRVPSILTALEHNQRVAKNKELRNTVFAVICSSLGQDERDLETTGLNRGVHMKCFTSREKALSWLMH